MVGVTFTANLDRHVSCPRTEVAAETVAEALRQVFADQPGLESYILDDQGRVRKHVVIFVDGDLIEDRVRLSDRLSGNAEIYVAQALSGG